MIYRRNALYYVQQVSYHVVLAMLAIVFVFPLFWLITGSLKPGKRSQSLARSGTRAKLFAIRTGSESKSNKDRTRAIMA